MKIAVLTESPADDEAIHIWVAKIIGIPTERIPIDPRLRTRGWPRIRELLPRVLKQLHYKTDTDCFVMVADSDYSPIHNTEHENKPEGDKDCRVCLLRHDLRVQVDRLTQIENRLPIKTAVGVAVPAIEAWYRCNLNPYANEAIWQGIRNKSKYPFTKASLKKETYGMVSPSVDKEIEYILASSGQLASNVPHLEQLFPGGFGSMASDIRRWLDPKP